MNLMNNRTYATEGIILARRNIGEADRLLTIYTKHYGKLKVVAKGIRRTTSRKRGSLELFTQVKMFAVRGKTFDILTEVEVKDNFNQWRADLLRVGVAYHLTEVINRLTQEGQEHRKVYELLFTAFNRLNDFEYVKLPIFISAFKKAVLTELGFLNEDRGKTDYDSYIEELIQGSLRTKRFLRSLS